MNPSLREEVLGEKPYPNLSAVPIPIDIVNIFRKSEDVPPIVEEALSLAPQCIWMQMGIENPAAAAKARAQGIWVVMNHCLMVEHKKILNH